MSDIYNFIGDWRNEFGNRLEIRKQSSQSALVSFLSGKDNKPVLKPYDKNIPSIQMYASLADYGLSLDVELWKKGKGLLLSLLHEDSYELDSLQRESLVPSFVRNTEDEFLEKYFFLFQPLEHYIRIVDA